MTGAKRLVVGISGASGAILGIELLQAMRAIPDWETHLVVSDGARRTIALETPYALKAVAELATRFHPVEDVGALIASGTFRTCGMVVVPCSMKTVAGIASGYADNLLLRAADVTLKERRPLVLVPRETPLNRVHLRNLLTVAELGAVILPPMLTFYTRPAGIEDMTRHVVGRILDVFGLELPGFRRWGDPNPAS
ncbi:MAG: UbiX family flavin prenyltransferase [Holophaga sp.]|nr:UbiX family flavin prenyltransferase [Holophaga sp.]